MVPTKRDKGIPPPPRVGRDCCGLLCCCTATHFNPPSPWGEGRHRNGTPGGSPGISIHPPREGRDFFIFAGRLSQIVISIHPPRKGRDSASGLGPDQTIHFNPPSPQGEGLQREWANAVIVGRFQSTLPARGGTCGTPGFEGVFAKFQSTLPVWGGTLAMQARCPAGLISIHSPRGGRD